jgi:hypothetical protein
MARSGGVHGLYYVATRPMVDWTRFERFFVKRREMASLVTDAKGYLLIQFYCRQKICREY